MRLVRAYVGVGSNLGDREAQARAAFDALAGLGLRRASSLYLTEPLGDPADPWYVNAVAELETGLSAEALLAELRALEVAAGRPAERAKGEPRPLDLDLLLYGDAVIDRPGLVVPHPGLAARRFVLAPLAELAPELVHPVLGARVADLLSRVDDPLRIEKL